MNEPAKMQEIDIHARNLLSGGDSSSIVNLNQTNRVTDDVLT